MKVEIIVPILGIRNMGIPNSSNFKSINGIRNGRRLSSDRGWEDDVTKVALYLLWVITFSVTRWTRNLILKPDILYASQTTIFMDHELLKGLRFRIIFPTFPERPAQDHPELMTIMVNSEFTRKLVKFHLALQNES